MQPPPPISRRNFLKKGAVLAGSLLAAGGLVGSYSSYIEPKWYDFTRITLSFERLPNSFHGLKLVQFSDLHIGHHFNLQDLEHIVTLINKEKPDILTFTGDLFDAQITEDPALTSKLLASLEAPLGKWAVLGNHDKWVDTNQTLPILQEGGFQTLLNAFNKIAYKGQSIQIAGVEDKLTGKPDITKTLHGANAQMFTLLLSHCPDFANEAAAFPIDLQLSGHSHGGQVRLPVVGALFTPLQGKNYVMGLYEVPNSKLLVYTNRGIGTTFLPFRFLCRPEITVITLEKRKP
ncbi:metallophosphoesterase [Paenibacillus aceris]|uniref:MPP superfamily phosphohydrolase n=1 Tax=Paenibacillus aceris TaxID=869555 RepID=A0ABS4HSX6_9BACL|nr:metallophosphoesterase [Paenibacillus aceris]MBP1961713.1 putative MPP superfamily phosphohydrolase [Paenibacillus aceris]NHW34428.1 metallophosphoesterase [Paenibacillus aceris]